MRSVCLRRVIPSASEGPHIWSWRILRNLCDRSSFARSLTSFGMTKGGSENENSIPYTYEVFHARGVPVRQANAAVTGGAADCLGIVGAVNADAGLVQTHPKNANEIVRAWWKIVIVFRAHTVIEHAFIVTEPRPDICAENFPSAHRRRQCFRSRCNRKDTDELVLVEYLQKMFVGVDKNLTRSECRIFRDFPFGEFLNLKGQYIWHL